MPELRKISGEAFTLRGLVGREPAVWRRLPHGEVLGRTIGIVGYGRIGREVAEREEAEKESGLKIEGWH
jgi:phosphoglycerate dehydrogenase-like enzyme